MRSLKYIASSLIILAPLANAADYEVVGFAGNGELVWTDTNTNGTYSVQWSPSMDQPVWSSDWSSLNQISATGGLLTAKIPMYFRVIHRPRQSPAANMMLVSGGGQPQGPQYDFYMSKYEVSNDEYCEFLNNAEANPSNELGRYMYFRNDGSVYSRSNGVIMFNITDSRLIYNSSGAIGGRYSIYNDYIGHPIVGVSWYGAVKYCNWLTVREGRGTNQRCYNEGQNDTNWHPAHLTYAQFSDGLSDGERLQWVQNYTGFRLPMDHYSATANYYNEFYKAAAWNGTSTSVYAFGRGTISSQDANYTSSGDPFEGFIVKTTPLGYYDGSNHGGAFQTRTNGNYWGIYDLSGNVAEWLTEQFSSNHSYYSYRGGGWSDSTSSCRCDSRDATNPFQTSSSRGFRVVSTAP